MMQNKNQSMISKLITVTHVKNKFIGKKNFFFEEMQISKAYISFIAKVNCYLFVMWRLN